MHAHHHTALVVVAALVLSGCGSEPTGTLSTPSSHVALATNAQQRITGDCKITSVVALGVQEGVLTQFSTADCRLTHLGRTASSMVQRVDLATLVARAEVVWTTASGDVVRATSVGQGTATGPGTVAFTGTVTIGGGTGRFANASGTLAVSGTADNVNGTGSSRYDGWVDYDASDRGRR